MTFCDIGNTSYHFLRGNDDFKEMVESFEPSSFKEKVFYICVNPLLKEKLQVLENWIDLSSFIDIDNYYKTMGIDRIVASMAVTDAVIVDAGSAITVDVIKNDKFDGGFICVGLDAMHKAYTDISSALDYEFNFEINLERLPKNSQDAISYGCLKPLQREVLSYGMPIVLTGGDADRLKKIFVDAVVDKTLIFKGMQKLYSKWSKSLA
ncbi:MAG: type III pantothenate kinase [Epsilonproteobacteria bacterium]|nr:type III pantothenate kinase [Campylobacterota bacterium]